MNIFRENAGWAALLALGLGACSQNAEQGGLRGNGEQPATQRQALSEEQAPTTKGQADIGSEVNPFVLPIYDECSGRPFPFEPGDLIELPQLPDFTIQRLTALDRKREAAIGLPPPVFGGDEQFKERSLLEVVGGEREPMLLVNSEVMAKAGRIEETPGEQFMSTLVAFDDAELKSLDAHQSELLRAEEVAERGLVFEGRNPLGVAKAGSVSVDRVGSGKLTAFPLVPVMPPSNASNWGESLMITAAAVVQDEKRTYDPCTNKGDPDGVWTFKTLMTEMANEPLTGISPEDFTLEFLLTWLFPRTVNGDDVQERPAMWSEVIEPWLVASGGFALDLDRAPFRLLAIVNRLDLRRTSSGGGYFGGSGTPLDAGELRFVFGVVKPPPDGSDDESACELMEFTTIFEYGVPISGCTGVRDWARRWTKLNIFPAFGTAYRNQLEAITQDVVVRNAAPHKGNGSAINQIRTNEIALDRPWEMNEFTLTDEPNGNIPLDGMLQPHTVAQTPDDGEYSPTPNSTVSDFINFEVVPTVPVAGQCRSSHSVPLEYQTKDFRGGNSLVGRGPGSPPGTWFGTPASTPASSQFICGRHQFSLNTCNGCHSCDTATDFTHISPTSGIPATLSGFLTGISVEDTQFPSQQTWSFADLDRRFIDLYQVAGTMCLTRFPLELEMARLVREQFPEPIFDFDFALEVLKKVEQQALKSVPPDARPDPANAALLSDIGRINPVSPH